MQADETTQHQPEETIRPPDGDRMTDEEWEEFKKWKAELDNRALEKAEPQPPPMSVPRPNVLKATLTNVTGGMHFLLSNVDLPLYKKDQLWAELQIVFAMLDSQIAKEFEKQ